MPVLDRSFGNSYDFTKNNVMGTHVLAEVARVCDVYRFIHFSTDEVYGEGVSNGVCCKQERILFHVKVVH